MRNIVLNLLALAASVGAFQNCSLGAVIFTFEDNSTAVGAFFDDKSSGAFTVGGVEITATASIGVFNATGSGFGINQPVSGDDTDGFDFEDDPGTGVAEGLTFSFDTDVLLNNFAVSSFGASDEIDLSVDGNSIAQITSTGTTSLGDFSLSAGTDVVVQTIAGAYGNGWSLDSIEVTPTAVPEPGSLIGLSFLVSIVGAGRIKRRKRNFFGNELTRST